MEKEQQSVEHWVEVMARIASEQTDVLREIRNEINTPELRDRLAMAAMQACPNWMQDSISTYPEMARRCYIMANAMLEARKVIK